MDDFQRALTVHVRYEGRCVCGTVHIMEWLSTSPAIQVASQWRNECGCGRLCPLLLVEEERDTGKHFKIVTIDEGKAQ